MNSDALQSLDRVFFFFSSFVCVFAACFDAGTVIQPQLKRVLRAFFLGKHEGKQERKNIHLGSE